MILSVLAVIASIPAGMLIGRLAKAEVKQGKKYVQAGAILLALLSVAMLFKGWDTAAPYFFLTGLMTGLILVR